MSKQKNPDVRELLRNIHGLTADQIEDELGVMIESDGTVYDPIDDVSYSSLEDWAECQVGKQDEKIHPHHGWE